MEKKEPVKPIRVKLFCDECGKEMFDYGIVAELNFPNIYKYLCENGHIIYSVQKYPKIEYDDLTLSDMLSGL